MHVPFEEYIRQSKVKTVLLSNDNVDKYIEPGKWTVLEES